MLISPVLHSNHVIAVKDLPLLLVVVMVLELPGVICQGPWHTRGVLRVGGGGRALCACTYAGLTPCRGSTADAFAQM